MKYNKNITLNFINETCFFNRKINKNLKADQSQNDHITQTQTIEGFFDFYEQKELIKEFGEDSDIVKIIKKDFNGNEINYLLNLNQNKFLSESLDNKKIDLLENNFIPNSLNKAFDNIYINYINEHKSKNIEKKKLNKENSLVSSVGTDLTQLAKEGKLEECFGRERELSEILQILVRKQKNNPILIGEAGVGKTAIVELLALKLSRNLVPFVLHDRKIISLDISRVLAGARYRGEFEKRLKAVLDEILKQPDVILFIDEIHSITGTGSIDGSVDVANMLKPILSRTNFQCIGATTIKEYQRIEKDAALSRRFQAVKIEEPSIEETVNMLFGLRPSFEAFHNVFISPSALESSVELSSRYIYDRFLPDKAIDLIDRASAKEVINSTKMLENSVVSAIANTGLNHFSKLRLEAFRKGDIPTEFVFQEIENAYRNFLIRWLENPKKLEVNSKELMSPLSILLFDQIRLLILKRIDELLFSSNKPKIIVKSLKKIKKLSSEKNKQILENFLTNSFKPVNFYRQFLFLIKEIFLLKKQLFLKNKNCQLLFHSYFLKSTKALTFFKNLSNKKKFNFYSSFFINDIESYNQEFRDLSDLEKAKLIIFRKFAQDFPPILKKGIINGLVNSANINFTPFEKSTLYALLGYFSINKGRKFLENLNDPHILTLARKANDFSKLKKEINEDQIRELLSEMTGVPMQAISESESQKLLNLEKILHKKVIGQTDAVSAIAKAIRRSRLGIQNPNRPIASFFFCGPTGVGKTEVTKALATTIFGSEKNMIRLDMSEFMEKFSLSRLIGSPPGYVGYEEGGQLTDSVRRKPYSIVLFDEIEKAHPDILNILLQVLDDGRLTDSQKRLVLFDNTIIVMTSNAAAADILTIIRRRKKLSKASNKILKNKVSSEALKPLQSIKKGTYIAKDQLSGFITLLDSSANIITSTNNLVKNFNNSFYYFDKYRLEKRKIILVTKPIIKVSKKEIDTIDEKTKALLKSAVLEKLSTIFLPEFLNRIDNIIAFEPLKPTELLKICKIMLTALSERLKLKKIELSVSQEVQIKLAKDAYNPLFGARPLRRLITKYIEDSLSECLLKSKLKNKSKQINFFLNETGNITLKEKKLI